MAAPLCMKLNSSWKSPDLLGYAFRPALINRAQHRQRTKTGMHADFVCIHEGCDMV